MLTSQSQVPRLIYKRRAIVFVLHSLWCTFKKEKRDMTINTVVVVVVLSCVWGVYTCPTADYPGCIMTGIHPRVTCCTPPRLLCTLQSYNSGIQSMYFIIIIIITHQHTVPAIDQTCGVRPRNYDATWDPSFKVNTCVVLIHWRHRQPLLTLFGVQW